MGNMMKKRISSKGETIILSAVGDLAIHGQYNAYVEEHGPLFAFQEAASFLNDSDIVFGNLESVLSAAGKPHTDKRLILKGNPLFIDGLEYAGFNVLSLANNHSFDFGVEAFQEMRSLLKKKKIEIVGAGKNLYEARRPRIIECRGLRLLFLAYSDFDTNGYNEALPDKPGIAPLDLQMIKDDIKKNSDTADCVIVSLHWGTEFSHYPSPKQVQTAKQIIDSGAKIIIGHHSHVLQGIELYNGGVIAYNLGSFMMSGPSGTYRYQLQENNRESIIFKCDISKDAISNVDIIPTWLNNKLQPTVCEGKKRDDILTKLKLLSAKVREPGYDKFWKEMNIKNKVKDPIREWFRKGNYLKRIKNVRPADIRRPIDLLMLYIRARFQDLI